MDADAASDFEVFVKQLADVLRDEYASTDPNLVVLLDPADPPEEVIDPVFQAMLLRAVAACPSGIHRMSPDIDDLVQTSNNLASVTAKDGAYKVLCLTRGSVDSEKMDLAEAVEFDRVVHYSGQPAASYRIARRNDPSNWENRIERGVRDDWVGAQVHGGGDEVGFGQADHQGRQHEEGDGHVVEEGDPGQQPEQQAVERHVAQQGQLSCKGRRLGQHHPDQEEWEPSELPTGRGPVEGLGVALCPRGPAGRGGRSRPGDS